MDVMDSLTFAAQSRGAIGVRQYLQEHRQQVPSLFRDLSATVLLSGDKEKKKSRDRYGQSKVVNDVGIYMEKLPVRGQREIWTALASGTFTDEATAVKLARAFLRVTTQPRNHDNDAVCLLLAKMVLNRITGAEEFDGAHGSTTAFRRRIQRLTLGRVQFPVPLNKDDACLVTSQETLPSSIAMLPCPRLNKRYSDDVSKHSLRRKTTQSEARKTTATFSDTKKQERPLLTKEMEDRALGLANLLIQLPRSDAVATAEDIAKRTFDLLAEVVNDVHTTYVTSEQSFQCLCKILRMDCTSDEALAQITSWSSRYVAIVLETTVLPKIRAADSVISRALLQTALRFSSGYARTLLDSLLLPLLVGDDDTVLGPAQAEAITRILRSFDTAPEDQLNVFLLTAMTVKQENNSTPHLLSNESALLVFQNILNTKPVLSPLTVEKFAEACEAVLERPEAEQLRGSLKFATVIFTLISKYPQHCAGHVEIFEAIANQLTSPIMTKTTLRLLEKLKNSE